MTALAGAGLATAAACGKDEKPDRKADPPGSTTGNGVTASSAPIAEAGPIGPAGGPTEASRDTGTRGRSSHFGGQQPRRVRTYSERDESYMGSRAGQRLRRQAPTRGRLYSGAAAAAAATKPAATTVFAADPVAHLVRRATFGATPATVAAVRRQGIDAWLSRQLQPATIAVSPAERAAELAMSTHGKSIAQLRATREQDNRPHGDEEAVWLTIARQIWSERQLFEVMVDFWNDFLHVANPYDGSEFVRASFDTDVIRKHALGRYSDMFLAANRHPALLRYLNQDQSRKDRVNENLGRENMELYTVGVDSGYTETDVRQAALMQTGRVIKDDEFVYDPNAHHVGPITVMGFQHANSTAAGGLAASDAYLKFLALHPATAQHVARQLCLQFVSDTPPPALVARLAKAYTANSSAIVPVLLTLFRSSEFWASVGQKVRRPAEFVVATYRTLGVAPTSGADLRSGLQGVRNRMAELGQYPMGQPSPNGYPRVFTAWASAGTMIEQWNEARTLIEGGRKGFTFAKPQTLVGAAKPTTAGAYVDALAARLVYQRLTAKDRAAVLSVAGLPAGAAVDATYNGAVTAAARAILSSPYHAFK